MKSQLICLPLIIALSLASQAQELERTYINPHSGYSDAIIISSNNTNTIYIAGQVGDGGSLEEQIRVSFQHLLDQLAQAGASFSDVVKHTTYIKDYKPSDLVVFRKVREEMFGHLTHMPPNVLVGVTALYREDILVEMDAIAVTESK